MINKNILKKNLLVFTVFTQEKRFNDNADFDIGSLGS